MGMFSFCFPTKMIRIDIVITMLYFLIAYDDIIWVLMKEVLFLNDLFLITMYITLIMN